jgi:hypothetical protein
MNLSAKRAVPQPVSPVVSGNVKYSAQGDGRRGHVVASEVTTGKELWKAEIFHVDYKPDLEQDVQDVYIKELKLVSGGLVVKDEKFRCYFLDLSTRKVTKKPFCF